MSITGLGTFRPPDVAALKRARRSGQLAASPDKNRDTVQLEDVRTAPEIEVNGRKFLVSDEIAALHERVNALNQLRVVAEAAEQNAEAAKRQAKVLAEEAKAQAKALEIYRRIATGGRVPPEDEDFLRNFSPELYLAAKLAALTAKEHQDYDSVLDGEEEQPESGGESADSESDAAPVAEAVSAPSDAE